MKNNSQFSIETIIPIVVIVLSLNNINNHIDNLISLSVLVSLVGIIGSVLFFLKNPISTKLIYCWIISQILVIEPFFDLSQGFSLKFGFTLGIKSGDIGLNINVIAILMLGFVKILEAANLVGKIITLKKFRDGALGDIFPISGTIIKRVNLNNEKNWVLVELDKSFTYNEQNINFVLIKRKDDKTIKLKDKNQISFLRLVYNVNDLQITTDNTKFPFIDWVRCE